MPRKINRTVTFVVLVLLFFCSRTADAAMTYMVDPDLAREWNPAVSVTGMGWTELLSIQVILSTVIIGLAYFDSFKSPVPHPSESGLSFRKFAEKFYFGRKSSIVEFLFRQPKSWTLRLKVAGYLLIRVLTFGTFCMVLSIYVSQLSPAWARFLQMTAPYTGYVPFVVLLPPFIWTFLKREYLQYNATETLTNKPMNPSGGSGVF